MDFMNNSRHGNGNPYISAPRMARKKKMRPYGGYQDAYNFLFEDDEDDQNAPPTAPTTEDLPEEMPPESTGDTEDDQLAMMIATGDFSSRGRNPYLSSQDSFSLNTQRNQGVNPYLQETAQDIFSNYDVSNLGVWGDKSHQQRQSDHNTGDAQDFGVSDPNMGSEIVNKLQSEAGERNVKYIIYNGRIWNPSVSPEWRKYSGPDPHNTHIHVSYNR